MVANVLSDRISSPSSGCGKFWLPSRLTQTRYARQKGECPGGLRCASNFRQAVGLQIGRMSSLTSMGFTPAPNRRVAVSSVIPPSRNNHAGFPAAGSAEYRKDRGQEGLLSLAGRGLVA